MDWDDLFSGVRWRVEQAKGKHPFFADYFSIDALKGRSAMMAAKYRELNDIAEAVRRSDGHKVTLVEMILKEELCEAGAEAETGNVAAFREEILDAIAVLARAFDEADRLVAETCEGRSKHRETEAWFAGA